MHKRFLHWLYVILWLSVIFWFSSQPDLKSELDTYWDFIFRKIAHMSEYFVLAYLAFRAFCQYGFPKGAILIHAAFFSLFFAAVDELYQTNIYMRNGSLRDVAIDGMGIIIAIFLLNYYTTSNTHIPKP